MLSFLQGKKTYIMGFFGILYAISGFVTGHFDSTVALGLIIGSLTAMGVRNGITAEMQKVANLLPSKTLPPQPPAA